MGPGASFLFFSGFAVTRFILLLFATTGLCHRACAQEADLRHGASLVPIFEHAISVSHADAVWVHRSASLDRAGEQLLVMAPFAQQISLFDIDTGKEEILASDGRASSAWFDCVTGAVFMLKLPANIELVTNSDFEKLKQTSTNYELNGTNMLVEVVREGDAEKKLFEKQIVMPRHGHRLAEVLNQRIMELHHYSDLEAFCEGRVKWVHGGMPLQNGIVQYLASHDVFVILSGRNRNNGTAVVLDRYGQELGAFECPGWPIVVDSDGDSLIVYSQHRSKGMAGLNLEVNILSYPVRSDYSGLGRADQVCSVRGGFLSDWTPGTRRYRLRGFEEGEMRRFFQVVSKPDYQNFSDLMSAQRKIDASLQPYSLVKLLRSTALFGRRGGGLNELAAVESNTAFAIFNVVPRSGAIFDLMLNRNGDVFKLDSGYGFLDGVMNEERFVVLTHGHKYEDSTPNGNVIEFKVLKLTVDKEETNNGARP